MHMAIGYMQAAYVIIRQDLSQFLAAINHKYVVWNLQTFARVCKTIKPVTSALA